MYFMIGLLQQFDTRRHHGTGRGVVSIRHLPALV
jgi:hypothetical protein